MAVIRYSFISYLSSFGVGSGGVEASISFHLQRLLTNFSKLHIRLRRVSRYFKCRPCIYRVCCLFNYVSDLYGRRGRSSIQHTLHEA